LPRYVSFIDQSVHATVRFVVADNLIAPFELSEQSKLIKVNRAMVPQSDAGVTPKEPPAAPPSSVMNLRRFMCGWPPTGKR
jgi:hypothetical protein